MTTEPVNVEAVIEAIKPLINSRTERETLSSDTPLLSSGLIDSLSIAELCDALRDKFDVELDAMDIAADNADTPQQILGLVSAGLLEQQRN